MKGLKFLVSCVAVGALAMICSTASFAVDAYTVGASYSDGEVTLTVPEEYTTIVGDGDLTLLILTETGNSAASITNENANEIIQIDQASAFSTVNVGTLDAGTYYVRIGGASASEEQGIPNGFIAGSFTVPASGSDKPETTVKLIGDIDLDKDITGEDVNCILEYLADMVEVEDIDFYATGYADSDDDLTGEDANAILCFLADITEASGNVGYFGDFYYNEEEEIYSLYGDLYDEYDAYFE